jgi:hypothetical protein
MICCPRCCAFLIAADRLPDCASTRPAAIDRTATQAKLAIVWGKYDIVLLWIKTATKHVNGLPIQPRANRK